MSTTNPQGLNHLGGLTAEEFIEHYWQKKPLLIRSAFANTETWVDADTLAGLSLEEEVESRIVSGHVEQGTDSWQLQLGPFEENVYSGLGEKNWTLLVQAVDHYLPEVAQLMPCFDFIPAWRQDDVMVSYSVPGGSVGPHFDQYDVFLLQGSGEKTWQVGETCDQNSALLDQCPLSILENFNSSQSWTLAPGDMLYLPSNLSHFGVAETEGITLSVGFRAPSTQEFLDHFVSLYATEFGSKIHYQDADLALQKNSGWISSSAVEQFQSLLQTLTQDPQKIALTLAQLASQPKYANQTPRDHDHTPALAAILSQDPNGSLARDENTRINYLGDEQHPTQLFINGEIIANPEQPFTKDLILLLAGQRTLKIKELAPLLKNEILFRWFERLYNLGYFYYQETY